MSRNAKPANQQQRTTRRLTGLPSWPILLLAGREKAGKSYSAAQAAASDLIGRVLWVGIGEDDPDEYGRLPGGDRIELVEHDGTYRDILAAVQWAVEQPPTDGKPNLLVVDSMTRLWNLITDMAQDAANRRAAAKGRKGDGEADIHMDLWNTAADRWHGVMDALRDHRGPVIVTARLDEVTVMQGGKPTTDKAWKVQAHKSLPYDVGGIVELPERGIAYLTGIRTTRLRVPQKLKLPDTWTVDKLWRDLGLADLVAGERAHTEVKRADPIATQRELLLQQMREAAAGDNELLRAIAKEWAESHEGQPITEATDIGGLEMARDDLATRRQAKAGEAA